MLWGMADLQDELAVVLDIRQHYLLDIAQWALDAAQMRAPFGVPLAGPGEQMQSFDRLRRNVDYAEALTAAVLLRAGASWDVLAAGRGVSRQALHRRLAARAEDAYDLARSGLNAYGHRRLRTNYDLAELAKRLSPDQLDGLTRAPAMLAEQLAERRRTRGWWVDPGAGFGDT